MLDPKNNQGLQHAQKSYAPILKCMQKTLSALEVRLASAVADSIEASDLKIMATSITALRQWCSLVSIVASRMLDIVLEFFADHLVSVAKDARGSLPAWQGLITKTQVNVEVAWKLMRNQTTAIASIHNTLWDTINLINELAKRVGIDTLGDHERTAAAVSMATTVLSEAKASHIVAKGLKILSNTDSTDGSQKAKTFIDSHADDVDLVPAAFWQKLRQSRAYSGGGVAVASQSGDLGIKKELVDGIKDEPSSAPTSEGGGGGAASGGPSPMKVEPPAGVKDEPGQFSKKRGFKRGFADLTR